MLAQAAPPPAHDPGIERLLGSSTPTGAPPSFTPLATATTPAKEAERPATDPVFAAIAEHRAAYDAWIAEAADGRDLGDGPLRQAEADALEAVQAAKPQTVAELKAWMDYLAAIAERGEWLSTERLLPRINDALRDLVHAAPLSAVGTGYDAELLALGAELDRILALIPAAYAERFRLEAERDNTLPPVPDGLIADPDNRLGEDVEFFAAYVSGDEMGRRYYTGKAVERIMAVPRTKFVFDRWLDEGDSYNRVMKRVSDEEMQARADAVVTAFGPWNDACQRHAAAIGYTAAVARHEELERQARATFDRIEAVTPLTLAGLAVQARTMVTYSRGNMIRHSVVERLEEFASASVPSDPGRDDPLVAAFRHANAARDRLNDISLSTEGAEAAFDELQRVNNAVVDGTTPVSMAGMVAALEWAIAEFEEFHADEEGARDKGEQLVVALLRGALAIARRSASSAAPPRSTIDQTSALLVRRRQAIAAVDEGRYAGEPDALMNCWASCDVAMMAQPATTLDGAAASIEWARDELLQFGFRVESADDGTRLVLALLDGALDVLRRSVGGVDSTAANQRAA